MQRANAAYEAGDLLALLELQLQIEQVDLAHAANVAAEQVRHFNKVLAEQLRERGRGFETIEQAFTDDDRAITAGYADVGKLMPLTYAVVSLLVLVGLIAVYRDILDPVNLPT